MRISQKRRQKHTSKQKWATMNKNGAISGCSRHSCTWIKNMSNPTNTESSTDLGFSGVPLRRLCSTLHASSSVSQTAGEEITLLLLLDKSTACYANFALLFYVFSLVQLFLWLTEQHLPHTYIQMPDTLLKPVWVYLGEHIKNRPRVCACYCPCVCVVLLTEHPRNVLLQYFSSTMNK